MTRWFEMLSSILPESGYPNIFGIISPGGKFTAVEMSC